MEMMMRVEIMMILQYSWITERNIDCLMYL